MVTTICRPRKSGFCLIKANAELSKKSDKPTRTSARWDWASLLTWPGVGFLVLGECAVRVSPEWFPWLAPFGVPYAWGWLLALVGVFWRVVSFRWLKALMPAIVLLATWPSLQWVFATATEAPVEEQDLGSACEVLTFNVRRLDEYQWLEGERTRRQLAEWLAQRKEDVLCLQEFPADGEEMLRASGWADGNRAKRFFTWPQGAGPAIATSLEVRQWEAWMFPEGQGRVMQADVVSTLGTIRLMNVHLQSLYFSEADYNAVEVGPSREEGMRLWSMMAQASKIRTAQALELRKRMEESPYPVVLAGDFNDVPMSYPMRLLRKGRVTDAFLASPMGFGATYIGTVPGLRIDGIYPDTTLQTVNLVTHDIELSDHRPVSVRLRSR